MNPSPRSPAPVWQLSDRLRLREFAAHDVDDLVRMHRDARVRAQLLDDQPLDDPVRASHFVRHLQAFYRQHEGMGVWCAERAIAPDPHDHQAARTAYAEGEIGDAMLALLLAPEWRFCGWFSLVPVLGDPQEIEIGARLQPDAWGGLLALEGGEWLLRHAFDGLQQLRVHGYCDPRNRSAARCLRTLGFAATGLAAYNGHQAAQYRIERTPWQAWHALPRRQRLRLARQAG